jgi:transposase-like protein
MNNIVQSLKIKCAEAGTNLTHVCRQAGVNRSTIEKWKREEPTSLQIIRKLEKAIEEIKTTKA